jgi:hypothetical protein
MEMLNMRTFRYFCCSIKNMKIICNQFKVNNNGCFMNQIDVILGLTRMRPDLADKMMIGQVVTKYFCKRSVQRYDGHGDILLIPFRIEQAKQNVKHSALSHTVVQSQLPLALSRGSDTLSSTPSISKVGPASMLYASAALSLPNGCFPHGVQSSTQKDSDSKLSANPKINANTTIPSTEYIFTFHYIGPVVQSTKKTELKPLGVEPTLLRSLENM